MCMADREILPIRRQTLYNQSINQTINQSGTCMSVIIEYIVNSTTTYMYIKYVHMLSIHM